MQKTGLSLGANRRANMVVRNNRLIADNGMKLVNVDNSIAEEVWLSPSDNINNWREVTEAEALAIEEEERRKADEEANESTNE